VTGEHLVEPYPEVYVPGQIAQIARLFESVVPKEPGAHKEHLGLKLEVSHSEPKGHESLPPVPHWSLDAEPDGLPKY